MNQNYFFRKIGAADAREFFAMRMKALQTDPNSFVATMEEETAMTPADVEKYLTKNYVLGVFAQPEAKLRGRAVRGGWKAQDAGVLVGTLVFMEQERQKFKHIGILGGMYVHPEHRGKGLSRKLLQIMLKNLQKYDHLYGLQLKVVTSNMPAISLYESAGFSTWATEKNALLHQGKFFDQHHMALQFS